MSCLDTPMRAIEARRDGLLTTDEIVALLGE